MFDPRTVVQQLMWSSPKKIVEHWSNQLDTGPDLAVRQNRHCTKMHDFAWADQGWNGLMIFKKFADQDWIGFNFVGSALDSEWKILLSVHLCWSNGF